MKMFLKKNLSVVSGVWTCKVHLLNYDIACSRDNTQTFAFDDASGALTEKGFVGGNGNTENSSIVAMTSASENGIEENIP